MCHQMVIIILISLIINHFVSLIGQVSQFWKCQYCLFILFHNTHNIALQHTPNTELKVSATFFILFFILKSRYCLLILLIYWDLPSALELLIYTMFIYISNSRVQPCHLSPLLGRPLSSQHVVASSSIFGIYQRILKIGARFPSPPNISQCPYVMFVSSYHINRLFHTC